MNRPDGCLAEPNFGIDVAVLFVLRRDGSAGGRVPVRTQSGVMAATGKQEGHFGIAEQIEL
jgi:hypothetical protein